MIPVADFVENVIVAVSELATLSSDPALTSRPDPTFRPKFRNPDEIIDSDFGRLDVASHPVLTVPPTWMGAALWRRSPKD